VSSPPHVQEAEEEDLFAAALALPATERDVYLARACGDNIDLLGRLRDLVRAYLDAKSFLREDARITGHVDRIGPYQVLRELGEGGCGIAYLVEQTAPVKRQVALKVIKPGMDTKAVIKRFEAERQALAILDHPNIARVFDAGTTPEGRPYFVMELVRGIKITEYCAQSRLTVSERLSLFMQVCHAIQHAHQKGIIHRDIKPSNVLVTMHDGLPLTKVIDFGIAKAIQGKLIDQTLHTEIDQIMGTPAYISPEQTRSTHVAVDTRSDIYSLGVLLYELLTSCTPFDADSLAEATIEQLRHRICTEEPVRPSRRLTSFDPKLLARVATSNATTATKLVGQIRDDLDWIVMQCLEKEPSRRYQDVHELIADIDRYLKHDAVLARPPSFSYTLRKLARRNRIPFFSALAAIVFIVMFAVTMGIQATRIAIERDHAEREKQQARRVSKVALNVLAIADPFHTLANEVSAPAVLEQAAKSIKRELREDPGPRARLLRAVGLAYVRRGEFKTSIGYLNEAVRVLRQMPGAETEALTAMVDLSIALRISGDFQAARKWLTDGEDIAKRSRAERTAGYAKLLLNRGRVDMEESRIPEARANFERSLQLYQEIVGTQSVEVAEVLSELSTALQWMDETVLAEKIVRQSIGIYERTVPSMYPDRIQTEARLADTLYLQNRLDEAASILLDTLPKSSQLFGVNSVEVADILDKLSLVRYSQRRLREAESYSRDALEAARVVYGDRHPFTANMAAALGRMLAERAKYSEAETTFREALDIFAATVPPDHQYIASAEYFLGEVLLATKRPREAEAVLTASMKRWERSGAPRWRVMRSASALGEALFLQGRTQEAENYLAESFRELSGDAKADAEAKERARKRSARYLKKSSPTPRITSTTPSAGPTQ